MATAAGAAFDDPAALQPCAAGPPRPVWRNERPHAAAALLDNFTVQHICAVHLTICRELQGRRSGLMQRTRFLCQALAALAARGC